MRSVYLALAAMLTLVTGCDDNDGSSGGSGSNTNIDETGIYSGNLVFDNGNLALMRLNLARDGTTTISLDTDNDEVPNTVFSGTSGNDDGTIIFSGSAPQDGGEIAITISIAEQTATGALVLDQVSGNFSLALDEFSARSSTLADVAGEYARVDNIGGLSSVSITSDGDVTASGACSADGSLESIDEAVNLYRLQLESDCITLDALASREDQEREGDVLAITGQDGAESFALDLYRP